MRGLCHGAKAPSCGKIETVPFVEFFEPKVAISLVEDPSRGIARSGCRNIDELGGARVVRRQSQDAKPGRRVFGELLQRRLFPAMAMIRAQHGKRGVRGNRISVEIASRADHFDDGQAALGNSGVVRGNGKRGALRCCASWVGRARAAGNTLVGRRWCLIGMPFGGCDRKAVAGPISPKPQASAPEPCDEPSTCQMTPPQPAKTMRPRLNDRSGKQNTSADSR